MKLEEIILIHPNSGELEYDDMLKPKDGEFAIIRKGNRYRKLYLYDFVRTKKEMRSPLEQ